ncbi:MAG: hypothetical protein J6R18_00620, partial [Kiritimatiellae bacterium]|nr:hypothetical protein [Kiritimatiellia bacterium]
GNVPTIPCGEYTLAVSLGDPDGTPRIALPLRGGRPDRRYPLGKIVLNYPKQSLNCNTIASHSPNEWDANKVSCVY